MKKFTFLTVFLFFSIFLFNQKVEAQNATWNYILNTTASSPVDMTGATYFAAGGDDKVRQGNFPFTFQVYDDVYSTSDVMKLGTNGFLMFNGSIYNNTRYIDTIPTNYVASKYVKGEFVSYGGFGDGSITSDTIFQKTTGTSPNRVYTLQFVYTPFYSASYRATIQISLFEGSNKIAVDYSNISGTFSGANVGDHIGINAGVGNYGTRTGNLPTLSTRYVFTPGADVDEPVSLTATTATSSQIDLSFVRNADVNDVIITWNTVNDFDAPTPGTVYTTGNEINPGKGTVIYQGPTSPQSHNSLTPNTKYYYQAWSKKSTNLYSADHKADSATTNSVIDPSNFQATAASKSQINLSWNKNSSNEDVIILWNTTNTFGNLVDNHTYVNGDNVIGGGKVLDQGSFTSKNHTGLSTNTTYYYKVWSFNSQHYYSSPGITANETTLPPTDPTNFTAIPTSCSIDISWTKTDGNDVLVLMNTSNTFGTPVTGTSYVLNDNLAGGGTVISVGTATSVEESPLDNGIHHYYKAFSFDGVKNYSTGVNTDATTTDVDDVAALNATPSVYQIDLSWTQNAATDDVIILWNSTNTFGSLTDGTTYNVNDAIVGGGTVLDKGSITNKTHTSLIPNTTYYYKVLSYDCNTNYSAGSSISKSTSSISDPTNLTATSTSCSIDISWTLTNGNDVLLLMNTTNTFGTPTDGNSYLLNDAIAGGGTVISVGSGTTVTESPLDNSLTHYYKAFSFDGSHYYSAGVTTDATTSDVDDVTALAATSTINQIDLSWTQNAATDDVIILWNSTNTFGALTDGTTYNVNDAIVGGGTVLDKGALTTKSHSSLSANTTYYYKVLSYDCNTNYSTGSTISKSTSSISDPTNLTATSTSCSIDISWTLTNGNDVLLLMNTTNTFGTPTDGNSYLLNDAVAGGGTVISVGSGTTVTESPLDNSLTHYYKAFSFDGSHYYSAGVTTDATTSDVDDVTALAATSTINQIDLSWTQNAATDDVIILWNSTNTFGSLTDGTTYNVNDAIVGGGTVLDKGALTTKSHSSLSANTTYYYKVLSYDCNTNYSAGSTISKSTSSISDPTNLTATSTSCSIDISWTLTNGNDVLLLMNTTNTFGTPTDGNSYLLNDAIAGGGTVISVGSGTSATESSLDNSLTHYYKAFSFDGSHYYSAGVTTDATTSDVDDVTALAATSTINQIDLSWTQNAATDDVIILWNSTNTFGSLTDGTTYNVNDAIVGGGTVLDKGALTTKSHSSLSANTTYYYKVLSYDCNTNYSAGSTISKSTSSISDPTNLTATSTSCSIDISWTLTNGNDVLLLMNTTNTFGTPTDGNSYLLNDAIAGGGTVISVGSGTSATESSLDNSLTHYYKAFSFDGSHYYSAGVTTDATTSDVDDVTALAATSTINQIDLSWTQNAATDDVIILWNSTNTFGSLTDGTTYNVNDAIVGGGTVLDKGALTTKSHSSLSANTTYYYKVLSYDCNTNYSAGSSISETTSAPSVSDPTNLAATSTSCSIDISWTLTNGNDVLLLMNTTNTFGTPTNGNSYLLNDAVAGGGTVIAVGSGTSATESSLDNSLTHYYKAFSYDGSHNYSTGVSTDATTTTVSDVTALTSSATGSTQIDLSWTQNAATDDVIILWNSTNTFGSLTDGTTYNVNDAIVGGGTVLDKGALTTKSHSSLSANTTYYYKVLSYDCNTNYSAGSSISETTSAPSVSDPTNLTATSTSCSIDISWTQTNGNDVLLLMNTTNTFGTPTNGNSYLLNDAIVGGGTVIFVGSGTSATESSLDNSLTHYYKAFSYDGSHNYSTGVSTDATTTTVSDVTALTSSATGSTQIDLSWTQNAATDDVIILWNTTNTFGSLTDGTTYNVNDVIVGGGTVLDKGALSSKSHTGLTAGNTYYYKVLSFDCGTTYSGGQTTSSTTLSMGNPTNFVATANSTCTIDLSWTKDGTNDVMIVYNTSNSFGTPFNGYPYYTVGTQVSPNHDTVLYIGSASNAPHTPIVDNQKYYYKAYSYNASYYFSSGVAADDSTALIADPSSISSVGGSTSIDLSWNLNAAGDDVIILSNTTNTFGTLVDGQSYTTGATLGTGLGKILYQGTATSKTDAGLTLNTEYFYKFQSYDCAKNYSAGQYINDTTESISAPSNFQANSISASQIDLSWIKNGTGDDVIITRNLTGTFTSPNDGTPYYQNGSIGTDYVVYKGSATSVSDNLLNPGTTYYYKIWSVSSTDYYSSGLNSDATTDGILNPDTFYAATFSNSQINLSWNANANSDSVMIVYNTVDVFAQPINGTVYPLGNQVVAGQGRVIFRGNAVSDTSFSHTGLSASTKYYYKIWSYDNSSNYYSSPGIKDTAWTMAPGIATFPHIEDFETQIPVTGSVSGCQTSIFLTTSWTNTTGDQTDWVPRQGTTPSGSWGGTGPSGDNTTTAQTGTYLYTESSGCSNKEAWLLSPIYNFVNLTTPQLEFYYHMHGSNMGQLSVQVSTNGGTTWSSNLFYKTGQQHATSTAPYTQALVNLGAYAGLTDIRIRIKGKTSGWNSDMAIDDIKVYQPTPMYITSVTTEQDTVPVIHDLVKQGIIRVKISAVGDYSFLSLSSLSLSTTGTEDLADIENARIYYTGNDPDFATNNQFGSVVASPNGSYSITGSQVLFEGNNYFWLAYDIKSTATMGHVVDASCSLATISTVNYVPTVTSPPGTKTIVGQVTLGPGGNSSYDNGPVYRPYYFGAHEAIYTSTELGTGSKEISQIAWHKASGINTTDNIDPIKVYMKNSTSTSFSSGSYSLTGYTLVYTGPMPNDKVTGWMKIPLSTPFLYDGTSNIHVLVTHDKPSASWSGYAYYSYTSTTVDRARGASGWSSAPTYLYSNSTRPDIQFQYLLPAPMVYVSSSVFQAETKNVGAGDTDQKIIGLKVVTNHTGSPLSVTNLALSTAGSTLATDILNANVYYSGSNPTFAAANKFGSTVATPSGSFTVTGTQTLMPGDNYFWLAYDISSSAVVNDVVDAECTSFTLGGVARIPTPTSATGNRKIKKYVIIGDVTSTNSDYIQPIHYYQDHGWEAIYTSTELGAAKDLTALAFYKKSGSNTTDDIQNISIYLKHTTANSLSSGPYSTSGYTLVYTGPFTNDDVSGWMQVEFTNSFTYNGTDNIEVMILQNYGTYFSNYPWWSYNTTTTDRARFASSWSGIPSSLTASDKLANIRFEYEPPMPMVYVSSTTAQMNITNVYSGLVDQEIIEIQVVTNNSLSPLDITSFALTTNGSTDAIGDILNAKIYYTANSSTFSTTNLFGTKVNPYGSFTITGNQSLTSGTNHFWLAYDIQPTATVGNHVDGECNSITVSSSVEIPTITNPPGNRTIIGALSGYYTIGATGDYSSFTAAISALNTYGISDWVTFQVQAGTYTEKITLGTVTGISASRPITFESLSGDSTDVILTYGSGTWSDAATLKLDAEHYIIRNMTIKATGSYGHAIEVSNSADNNIVRNNVLISTATYTGTQGATVYANQVNYSDTRIVQNKIEGTYYGIYLRGNWSSDASGWAIDSNNIVASQYGIYFNFVANVKARANVMTIGASSSQAYGIYIYYGSGNCIISENKIETKGSSYSVGIYSYYSTATSTTKDIIVNNFIANTANSSSSSNGIELYNCDYVDIFYNNINITSTSSSSSRSAIDVRYCTGINIKNNNFIAPGGGYAVYYGSSSTVNSSNYNNLYSSGNIGYYNGSTKANLAAWKLATSMDANSVSMTPTYTSTTDLHIGNSLLDNKGNPISGINFDIDGAARHSINPDIGADEFGTGVIDAGISTITDPAISTCGSGSQSVKVNIKNYGNTALTSATVNWKVGGVAQTAYSWTGSLAAGATANVTLGSYNFAAGTVLIEAWTSSPNGVTDQYPSNDSGSANIEIGDPPVVNAGADTSVCTSAYSITDASSVNHTYLLWTTSGTGVIAGQNTITPTYMPSAADYTAGSVYLKLNASNTTCSDTEDSVLVTLSQPPTITFTGLATSYCTSDPVTPLVGDPNGGTFSGDGVVGSSFDPSTAIIGTNTVTYTYTSGICTDSAVKTTIVGNAPIAFAGNDTTLCGDSVVIYTATATNYTTLLWTSTGSGVFVNDGTINPTYKPSTADYTAGSVNLILTATGSCSTVKDTFLLTIYHFPTVSFSGLSATYCSSDAASVLVGTPNGGTFSGDGVVGSTFDPSTAVIGTNNVKYFYTNGTCSDSSIQTTVVSAPPVIFAGNDTTVCANYYINSTATAINYSSLLWTSSGSGTFDDDTILTPTFTPSAADFTAGNVYLKLSATSSCSVVQDSFLLTISAPPTVSFTGLAASYCNTDATATLTGNPIGGTFSGDAVTGSTFDPSTAIIGVNKVKYTYTIGMCTDSAIQTTTVSTAPIVFAGNDTSVCVNSYTVPDASVTSYVSLQWTTSGGGTFTDGTTLGATYFPSASDFTNGSVYLRLTAIGTCSNVTDSLLLTVSQPPSVTFTGLATQYCENDAIDTLVGVPSGGIFIGTAMTSNYFNPANAVIGSNTIKYAYSNGACSDTAESTVMVNSNPTVVLGGLSNTYCSNDATVTLTGLPVGGSFSGDGVSGNTFDPSDGAITSPTTVYYSYTDGTTSCSSSDTQSVVVNSAPVANAGPDKYVPIFTATTLSGSATGTGTLTYSWSPSNKIASGGSTLTPTTTTNLFPYPREFTLTVTDNNSCSSTDKVDVILSTSWFITVSVTGTPSTICTGDSVHLESSVTGGDANNIYSWTSIPAGFTSSAHEIWIHPTQSAWYKLYVSNGTKNDEDSIYITVHSLPSVSFTGLPTSICTNEDSVHLIGTPSAGTFTGSGVISEYFYPANAGDGTYDITYSVTDANSCTNTDTQTVVVNAAPIANAGIDQPIISGNSATLSGSASAGSGTYNYAWTPSSNIASGANSATATTNALTTSSVFVLTVTDANSCTDEDDMFVSVGNAIAATVTASPDSICTGSSSQLNVVAGGGNGTYTYSWSSVPVGLTSTITNPTVSPTITTLYNVEVTDGTDTINSSITVYVGSLPTANAGSDQTIASGSSTTLSGSATGGTDPYSYSWTPVSDLVNANIQNPTTNALTVNTTFTLNVSDAVGCTATDDMEVIISTTALSVTTTATPNTICEGESSQLQATAIGGSGTYTYSWSSTPSGFASTLSNPIVSPTATTTYTVTADDGLTTSNSSVVVTVNSAPFVSFNGLNGDYCDNDASATLSGLPVGGSFSGNGISGNQFDPSDAAVTIGSNQVIYTVSQNGCIGADTQFVSVHETPIANAGTDQSPMTATPSTVTLSGSYSGGTNVGYFWTPIAKIASGVNTATPTTVPLNFTTQYTLETKDTVYGCSSTDDMIVNIDNVADLTVVASATPDTICEGETTSLLALSTGSPNYTYAWTSVPSGFTSTISNPTATPTTTTTYQVIVVDALSDTDTAWVTVVVNPIPVASITGLLSDYCDNSGTINLVGTPVGGTFSGTGVNASTFDPSQAIIGVNNIVYSVSQNSCTGTDTAFVNIHQAPIAIAGSDITMTAGDTVLSGSYSGGSDVGYSWSPSNMLIQDNISNPRTVSLTSSQSYTLTTTDTINSCYTTDIVDVIITGGNVSIAATATPDTICNGETSNINTVVGGGNGVYTYSWTSNPVGFISSTADISVAPNVTTTYTVSVVSNGTNANTSVVVTVNALPNVSFTGLAASYCENASAVNLVGAPAGGTFTGFGMIGNQFNPSNANIGNNQIIYSVNVNSCAGADTQYVNIIETPIANAGSDITMASGSTTLNGSYTGGNDVGYFWTPINKLVDANVASPTTVSLSSTTTFTLETKDTVNGCSSTDNMNVNITGVPLSVIANSTPGIICAGDTLFLTSQVTGGNTGTYSYLWSSSPSGYSSTVATPQAYPTVNTTYTVRVIDGNDTATANTSVIVNPLPSVSFVGLGTSYCNNNSSVSLAGTPSGGTFSGNGIVGNQFDPSQANIGQNTIVYSVTVNSCTNTDSKNVDIIETPIANAGTDIIMAAGDTILNGSYSGGNDVGYFWTPTNKLISSNIANPHTIVLSSTQTYYLETKDTVNLCSSTDNVNVTITGGAVSIAATASPTSICEGDTSNITTIVSGGNGTYLYSWSSIPSGFTSSQADIDVSPSVNTTYTVLVTSGSSSNTSSVTVNVNPIPVVTFSGLTTPVCSDASQMTLVGSPSGGVFSGQGVVSVSGSYKFDASLAGSGNWNIVYAYTDATTLCSSADTQNVGVNSVPIVNAGVDQLITQNSTASLTGSATGAANYKYAWIPSSMVVNANAANTQTVALTNSQLFTLQVEDSVTTCSSTDDVLITVSSPLPVSASASASPTIICDGESSQLDVIASGGTGIYTYSWTSVPVGFTSSIKNPIVNPSLTTAYSVVVSDGSTNANTSVTITVNPSPVATISGLDTSYCNNGISDTLVGIPAGGFFNGNGITSNLFNPINAGVGYHTIVYTYTAANGCTDTDTIITHVYSAPVANAGIDDTITAPSTATLSGSASGGSNNYNYSWSPASLFTNANMQSVTTTNNLAYSTIFTLEVEDINTTCRSADDVQVTVIGGPLTVNPMVTPDTICAGDQIQLNALVGGGTGNYQYAWTSIPSGYIQMIANPVASPTVNTTYILNVFDGAVNVSSNVEVVVGAIPTVSITTSTTNYCSNGNNETLLATPSGGVFYGNGISGNVFSPSLAGIGNHQIIYDYTSPLGCSNSDTTFVNVDQAPIADAGSDITIPCNSGGGLIGSAAVGNTTYSWTPSNTLTQPTASQTIANPSVNTLYTVLVTNTITNCTNTDQVMVNVTGGPTLSVTNDTIICGGGSVTISANSNATSFMWSNGVATSSFTASPTVTTVYTVTVTDASTCAAIDSVVVGVHFPYVNLGPDIILVDTQMVLLDAGYGFDTYTWNTGDITQFIEVQPYVNSQLGYNKFVVEVSDLFGCQAKDSVMINYVLDIEGIENNVSFNLYPNPTDGRFILEIEGTISESYSLEVVNMQSQLLMEKEIDVSSTKYTESIDLSTWPKGIYLIRLKSENYISTKKLIIK